MDAVKFIKERNRMCNYCYNCGARCDLDSQARMDGDE